MGHATETTSYLWMPVAGIVIATVAVITGCVSVENYPQDWPQLVEQSDSECPDFSGRYRDLAEDPEHCSPNTEGQVPSACSLINSLVPTAAATDYWPEEFVGRITEISPWDDDVLTLRTTAPRGTTLERTLHLDDEHVQCRDGRLWLADPGSDSFGGYGFVAGNIRATFQPARDGSLIMKSTAFAAGVITVVPVIAYGRNYSRWPRAAAENMEPQWLTPGLVKKRSDVGSPSEDALPLHVAILPSFGCDHEHRTMIAEQAAEVIRLSDDATLMSDRTAGTELRNRKKIWSRTAPGQWHPDSGFIFRNAADTDLDALIMISCSATQRRQVRRINSEVYALDLWDHQVLHESVLATQGESPQIDVREQLRRLLERLAGGKTVGVCR